MVQNELTENITVLDPNKMAPTKQYPRNNEGQLILFSQFRRLCPFARFDELVALESGNRIVWDLVGSVGSALVSDMFRLDVEIDVALVSASHATGNGLVQSSLVSPSFVDVLVCIQFFVCLVESLLAYFVAWHLGCRSCPTSLNGRKVWRVSSFCAMCTIIYSYINQQPVTCNCPNALSRALVSVSHATKDDVLWWKRACSEGVLWVVSSLFSPLLA